MFAKILRIVAKWYGNPTSDEVFPQLFDDAIHAWRTGKFEGESVFQAQDPDGPVVQRSAVVSDDSVESEEDNITLKPKENLIEPDKPGIRIELTRISSQK